MTSPTTFKMSEFFEKEESSEGLYSAISGKRIKRSIERTEDDLKFEQERHKKLEACPLQKSTTNYSHKSRIICRYY